MFKKIGIAIFLFGATYSTFAAEWVWFPAYTFKVFENDKLIWDGEFKEGERVVQTRLHGVSESPQCRGTNGVAQITNMYCEPSLKIDRDKIAANASCPGFALVENRIERWEWAKIAGGKMLVPVEKNNVMCIGEGETINFTGKTPDGWFQPTNYRIEMTKKVDLSKQNPQ